ncbi:hypothetical protein P171DRAFT_423932 [Karstenula rhodostoma CBS 690.94]|uniref:Uncharacterized protein n=1 Tax=Karstenula rhodostoma CBS 690.94 TaxID=1392251 RepID=A0A9P4P8E5_9PLEO|nr:hypothetical protein P171DRAFT_423932 [Karstenula rhodostoma CBS 690.94]
MSRRRVNLPDHHRVALAHALGYDNYPNDLSAEPHIRYIANRHIGRGTLENHLCLFVHVIKHCSADAEKPTQPSTRLRSIRALLDALISTDGETMFADTNPDSVSRREDVEDTVMYIVGTWAMLLGSFVQAPNGFRKVILAYNLQTGVENSHKEAYYEDLEGLIRRSSTRVNAFTLNVLAAVKLQWTYNISQHMLLSRIGGRHVLEIFALPCALNATSLANAVGIPSELRQEIQESYCILFNAWPDPPKHARIWHWLGIRKFCWCWSCSAHRHRAHIIRKYRKVCAYKPATKARVRKSDRQSEYDPLLVVLMNGTEASDWTQELFPCLWSRVVELEEHLQAAKPWSIWILFRDRRDTLQFWTFCFATVVVLLTFVQVVLGVAQVVGSFK